jgi:metal-dependent amidase/aminoacylase/carboxypeptidase family protein
MLFQMRYIEGTFRAMDEQWRAEGLEKIRKIAELTAEAMGGTCEVFIQKGTLSCKNEPELTRRMKGALIDYMGQENVIDLDIWLVLRILPSIHIM